MMIIVVFIIFFLFGKSETNFDNNLLTSRSIPKSYRNFDKNNNNNNETLHNTVAIGQFITIISRPIGRIENIEKEKENIDELFSVNNLNHPDIV